MSGVEKEHIARSPVLLHAVRLRDGGTAMVAGQAAAVRM